MQLAEASALAGDAASETVDARSERFSVIADVCGHVSAGGVPGARVVGLPVLLAMRALARNLREECCLEVADGVPNERYALAIRLHHALDAAATALGAAPACFVDPDDWSLPDEQVPLPLPHLASTARNAAMVCQGLRDLIAPASGGTALMRRDVFQLLAGSMTLRAICLDPSGLSPTVVRELAGSTQACVERICAAAQAWNLLSPEGPIGRLSHAIESSGLLAGDILADLDPASAPAP